MLSGNFFGIHKQTTICFHKMLQKCLQSKGSSRKQYAEEAKQPVMSFDANKGVEVSAQNALKMGKLFLRKKEEVCM